MTVKKLLQQLLQTTHDRQQSVAILILRIGVSASMIVLHGWPKLSNYIGGDMNFPDPLGVGTEFSLLLAIFAEVVCSVLLAAGALTRVSAIPLIITMLVAIFTINAGEALIVREKAFIFMITYLFMLIAGAGTYSVDAKLNRSVVYELNLKR